MHFYGTPSSLAFLGKSCLTRRSKSALFVVANVAAFIFVILVPLNESNSVVVISLTFFALSRANLTALVVTPKHLAPALTLSQAYSRGGFWPSFKVGRVAPFKKKEH